MKKVFNIFKENADLLLFVFYCISIIIGLIGLIGGIVLTIQIGFDWLLTGLIIAGLTVVILYGIAIKHHLK